MDERYQDLMDDDAEEELGEPRWWSSSALLTGEASGITAFTLAVTGLMGWIGFPVADAIVGLPDGPGDVRDRAIVSAMVVLLALLGSLWLAHRALADPAEAPAWARNLAGSAVVIAAIGSVLSIVTIVGSLLSGDPEFPGRLP